MPTLFVFCAMMVLCLCMYFNVHVILPAPLIFCISGIYPCYSNQRGSVDRQTTKPGSYLGNRVKDSLIRRDVNGGSDGAPLSPGVGNNLKTKRESVALCIQCLCICDVGKTREKLNQTTVEC